MTKSKKSIVMHGTLLCPLVLGHCAFLRANGTTYRTSTVVAIHEQSASRPWQASLSAAAFFMEEYDGRAIQNPCRVGTSKGVRFISLQLLRSLLPSY